MTATDIMFTCFLWFAAIMFALFALWDKSSDRDQLAYWITKFCSLGFWGVIILCLMHHLGVK